MFPIIPAAAAAGVSGNDEGIFGYGTTGSRVSMTNLVSNTGVVATDVTGVGTERKGIAACEYGEDKGIFGYGTTTSYTHEGYVSVTNLVTNAGVVGTDVTGVGSARNSLAACSYGEDKGIFAYGLMGVWPSHGVVSMSNLVSNAGVVATDVTGVGTARSTLAACEYGDDKGIFGFGNYGTALINLVSNAGVIATDTGGVGTQRERLAACSYGGDKGIFGYGYPTTAVTNLVSNVGVVATDTTGVGTGRMRIAACEYGGDKGIFGYGDSGSNVSLTNLVSNTGVVATDTTGVGTARSYLAACSFN